MITRKLGTHGPEVSILGLGCMGMSEFYGIGDEKESVATLERALELGITFWDTSDAYGPHTNEELLGRTLAGRRDKVFLATKFGIVRDPNDPMKRGISGRPEYVRQSVEGSLRRLKTDYIDLYYQHRVDRAVPIEETVGAMADLVKEGKVRHLGLSEASAESIRKAAKVHPITALQSEYSLWTRDPETTGTLAACRENGIALVAYSPLGRGFLTGAITRPEDFAEDDYRRVNPRFTGENFAKNLAIVEKVKKFAADKGCTPGQLALAWVIAKGGDIVPIPGTKRVKYLEENAGAVEVKLGPAEVAEIDAVFPPDSAVGDRYASNMMGSINA
ncbi:aryl-alcohol dehydrogenase-like predicted oxidoreductase [Luteibacter jiangsuensis]|uniref:Aryl-alcohol dehydrogenase-like predicted oxidoreductase n=1 Tax=Luteibacter jiangsuensis TaxID=637577 RepID=A0ABT9SX06_9GAMM|nr:aldo/keto reductase [Luteibacter jiangsuensis]MDQ0009539.1 aryl-alcohol dehydrogenase-like predicted oxidoreductase [Luteibacter jiangsuensis]